MISCIFSIETRKSLKTGKLYTALWCDLGYKKVLIPLPREHQDLLLELLNVTPYELANRKEGEITYLKYGGKE